MNLQEKWGETIHREAGIAPVSSSFDDVMLWGFTTPLILFLTGALSKVGWNFERDMYGRYGVKGVRTNWGGIDDEEKWEEVIEAHLSRDFKTLNVSHDYIPASPIPFISLTGHPYARLFAQVIAKIPARAFQPAVTKGGGV